MLNVLLEKRKVDDGMIDGLNSHAHETLLRSGQICQSHHVTVALMTTIIAIIIDSKCKRSLIFIHRSSSMKSSQAIVTLSTVILIVSFFSCIITGIRLDQVEQNEAASCQHCQHYADSLPGASEPRERPSHRENFW